MELRSSEASRYTAVETPIFTCINTPIDDLLRLLSRNMSTVTHVEG
jgi:chlorite dismutase